MNAYRYFRMYSYGDCVEEYIVKANSIEEAITKLKKYKESKNESSCMIQKKYFNEIDLNNDIIEIES